MRAGDTGAKQSVSPFRAAYAPDDDRLIARLKADLARVPQEEADVDARATRYIQIIRGARRGLGSVEDFLREYGLTTREGLALMVLAEALLRVPDARTADRLIEDKLAAAHFDAAPAPRSDTWLVSASSWALGATARLLHPGDTPSNVLAQLVKRVGMPAARAAIRQAMRLLGHRFVLGETIEAALQRAKSMQARGYFYSYDMLGEGARTDAAAERYLASYAKAIETVGKNAGDESLPARPGISVKLSALHPRYEATQRETVLVQLTPRLLDLARLAKRHELNLTLDAEEADRLEVSLDLFARMLADPTLSGWEGLGLAVQAYQKRAPDVIDWAIEAATAQRRRVMVRLVKGAYWDTEVKRAQERGLADYPVFTRKAATDACYLAAARRMLDADAVIYSQFATHNALTVAQVQALAGNRRDFEFQRLHGMGESLYAAVCERDGYATRIYAPVGGHEDLLAYLVRRLLENGANSSFVATVGDAEVPIERLIAHPLALIETATSARNPKIPLPIDLYRPARANSMGVEFGHEASRRALVDSIAKIGFPAVEARPLAPGLKSIDAARAVLSPIDGQTQVGAVVEALPTQAETLFDVASSGFAAWSRRPAETRAAILERAADLLQERRSRFLALLGAEGGRTVFDALAEVREAVDFCRYYAAQARTLFGDGQLMPGPTGEENRLRMRARGPFLAISPWNFPLAIFLGQVGAALLAGNTVVAKPAEQTPLVAFETVRLLHEVGVPQDALVFAPGDGALGAALARDPRVAGVVFTGSTETAWAINRTLAAKRGPIVPLIAETGGINAMIVDATALTEQVVDDVTTSAFRSAGQRCSATRLLFLQRDIADGTLDMLSGATAALRLGDPRDTATDIGPIIDANAQARLSAYIAERGGAAACCYAGKPPGGALSGGHWFAPHILEIGRAEDLTREIFGPILHVVRYNAANLGRVLEAIAATGYGLTLGVHSRIDRTATEVVDRLSAGNIYVNRSTIGAAVGTQPFGGSGLSGTGPKAGGPNYLARFALEQTVSINTAAAGGNASLIDMSDA